MEDTKIQEVQRTFAAWIENGKNIPATAKATGVHRATIYRHLAAAKALGMDVAGGQPAVAVAAPVIETAKEPAAVEVPVVEAPMPQRDATDDGFYPEDYIPKMEDRDLQGYVPREPYYQQYKDSLKARQPVLLIGETGTGKTSMVKYDCAVRKMPMLHVSCDGILEFGELFGYQGLKDGNTYFREGALIRLACHYPCVILLDEVSNIVPEKFSRLQVFIEERRFFVKEADNGRGKYYSLHPECRVVLAGNPPNAAYNGTNKMNIALLGRVDNITLPAWEKKEFVKIFKDKPRLAEVMDFYGQVNEIITNQNKRCFFSIRELKKIFKKLEMGYGVVDAIRIAFTNNVALATGVDNQRAFDDLALAVFKNAE